MRGFWCILPCALVLAAVFGCGGGKEAGQSTAKSTRATSAVLVGDTGGIPSERFDRIVELFNHGVTLMERFNPIEAVDVFDEVVTLAPNWTTGRLNLGIALLNAQDDSLNIRAEEELKKVIEQDPQNPFAHYALAMLFRHLSRGEEAEALFRRVLEIDPDDPETHYQLAVLVAERDPLAARMHLEKTLERIPHHESACYRLQNLLRKAGEDESARELLMRFKALKSARAGLAFGMKYSEMGHYAGIIRAFENPAPPEGLDAPPQFVDRAEDLGLTEVSPGVPGWPGESVQDADALSLGPGVGVADVDGDADLDVFISGAGGNSLYLNKNGRFFPSVDSGINTDQAVGAFFGDYDSDGDPDLFMTCQGPNRLYRNSGHGRFEDVTEAAGVAGGSAVSVGAAWADADHDGDLDVYVANLSGRESARGARNALWRNNGDGTFTETASEAGIDGGETPSMGVIFFDFDGDYDLDLYVINHNRANRLFLNQRVGQYTDATSMVPNLADDGPGLGAFLGDVDQNGMEDLILIRGRKPPRLFLQLERGAFVEDMRFAAQARRWKRAVGGLVGDFDNDGDLDLVFLGAGAETAGRLVLMNRGAGRFAPAVPFGPGSNTPSARGAVSADLFGNGSLDLVIARSGGRPELWRAPVPRGQHWLEVLPTLANEDGITDWVDPTSIGLSLEIKTGSGLQTLALTSSSGFLGSPPARGHFGLGERGKADYVRLLWADAVLQSEMEVAADQMWPILKVKRKPSSCPVLFSWDGDRFAFVTDMLGVGGVGFFVSPGEYAPPDPTEDVRIPPRKIAARNGRYVLRVTEPLEEVSYIDEMHLLAYDHPDTWEIYPDERFTGSPPYPTGQPFAVAEKIFPRAALDSKNEDVLDRLTEIDRKYVEPPNDPRFVGYARDHWIELDFGNKLRDLTPGARLVLCLYGWVEYTYSHVNYAASQAGVTMRSPCIEVPDGRGGWRSVVAEAGFPAGLPRMMTLDITDLPVRTEARFRIRTNMEVYWDQVFIAEDQSQGDVRVSTVAPSVARLRFLGYPGEYSPDGMDPTLYDYHRLDFGVPFKNMAGAFTRFGDVRPLLDSVDDRFVVMGRGEEIALEFSTRDLPELPQGWSRTLVLHVDGYCKDMDLYTAFPFTVEPLPYHGMETYPPLNTPSTLNPHQGYGEVWNTRRIVGQ